MPLADRHALIGGLRRRGSETELTQALATVFAAEPAMAAAFVRLVFDAAPYGQRINLDDLPEKLSARGEETVKEGRADLSFMDSSRKWHIIVEIKIHAGYGRDQVGRYLRSLDGTPRGALAAITRDVPPDSESSIRDERWAGSVQWSSLLPRLRKLVPEDPDLKAQWPLFLDVLEEEGSMGFTRANEELFRAWAKYPDARAHLVDFVDTLRRAALESLSRQLGEAAASDPTLPRTAAEVTFGQGERAVTPRFGKIVVGYRIPSERPGERLWMGLWGWDEPRFIVELPYPGSDGDPSRRLAAVEALLDAGFESWRDKILTRYLPLDSALLSSPNLQERVLKFASESFLLIAQSGVFALSSEALESEEFADVHGSAEGLE